MATDYEALFANCNLKEAASVLERSDELSKVPVIDEKYNLVGGVFTSDLKKYLTK